MREAPILPQPFDIAAAARYGPGYPLHTFGLTPAHAILVAQPFTVTPLKMLWSSKGYIDHFDWHPEEGTRLVVIDRSGGAVREHVTEAFFAFHTVNAFERGDATVLDLLAYPNADIMASLRTDRMIAELPELRPSLIRIIMRPGFERATVEKLSDVDSSSPQATTSSSMGVRIASRMERPTATTPAARIPRPS